MRETTSILELNYSPTEKIYKGEPPEDYVILGDMVSCKPITSMYCIHKSFVEPCTLLSTVNVNSNTFYIINNQFKTFTVNTPVPYKIKHIPYSFMIQECCDEIDMQYSSSPLYMYLLFRSLPHYSNNFKENFINLLPPHLVFYPIFFSLPPNIIIPSNTIKDIETTISQQSYENNKKSNSFADFRIFNPIYNLYKYYKLMISLDEENYLYTFYHSLYTNNLNSISERAISQIISAISDFHLIDFIPTFLKSQIKSNPLSIYLYFHLYGNLSYILNQITYYIDLSPDNLSLLESIGTIPFDKINYKNLFNNLTEDSKAISLQELTDSKIKALLDIHTKLLFDLNENYNTQYYKGYGVLLALSILINYSFFDKIPLIYTKIFFNKAVTVEDSQSSVFLKEIHQNYLNMTKSDWEAVETSIEYGDRMKFYELSVFNPYIYKYKIVMNNIKHGFSEIIPIQMLDILSMNDWVSINKNISSSTNEKVSFLEFPQFENLFSTKVASKNSDIVDFTSLASLFNEENSDNDDSDCSNHQNTINLLASLNSIDQLNNLTISSAIGLMQSDLVAHYEVEIAPSMTERSSTIVHSDEVESNEGDDDSEGDEGRDIDDDETPETEFTTDDDNSDDDNTDENSDDDEDSEYAGEQYTEGRYHNDNNSDDSYHTQNYGSSDSYDSDID